MRAYDCGSEFRVSVTASEVEDFARRWPCSGLRRRSVSFSFDKRNGDLIDTNDQQQHPSADGQAILALCDDAYAYGLARLKLRV